MENILRIGLLQMDLAWENPEKNRKRIGEILSGASDLPQLILLPEMFTTGFSMSPETVAETMEGPTLEWMVEWAGKTGSALVGSLAIEESGRYFNRMFFVEPDGKVSYYEKRHLFTLAGEDKKYASGKGRKIVEYNGFRINLQVCYDLRFPAFARYDGDYDLLLYVANWPKQRLQAWDTLLPARAVENMAFVAAVNRIGEDPNGNVYTGSSKIIDALGNTVASGEGEGLIVADLDLSELRKTREKFGFLEDRDEITVR